MRVKALKQTAFAKAAKRTVETCSANARQHKETLHISSLIGDSETLQVLVATTQVKVGKPDILVCNAAGEASIGLLEKVEAAVFDEAMISAKSSVWMAGPAHGSK